jgi:predicted phosphohydrolase
MSALLWSTDLHLDRVAPDQQQQWLAALIAAPGDALLLTGDISVAPRLVADLELVADAADRPIYYLLGNHDHYGSAIGTVRDSVIALAERRPSVQWLPPASPISLGPGVALVGVDGWADGRAGNALTTPIVLNDDRLIAELAAQKGRRAKVALKQLLADADAERLRVLLKRAAAMASTIMVATHVPPFPEMLPATGRLANPDWLPLLICGATGAVLRDFAAAHSTHRIEVLAGHTHVPTVTTIAPNLRCTVSAPLALSTPSPDR